MTSHGFRLRVVLPTFILAQLLLVTQNSWAQSTTQDGAYTLAGQCADVVASAMITSSSVPYGGTVTGPITFSLMPSAGQSTVTWDFTNKTETWNLFLNANSTLISELTGGAGLPVQLVETGALPGFNVTTTGSLAWSETQTGTINNGATSGIGSGTFTNPGTAGIGSGSPAIDLAFDTASLSASGSASGIPYALNQTILAGNLTAGKSSDFTITPTGVPEASPVVIALVGMMGISLVVKRRCR